MIGIFSNFEGVELLEEFMEVLYNPSEYKFTWILVIFFIFHDYFIFTEHTSFMKYNLDYYELYFVKTYFDKAR